MECCVCYNKSKNKTDCNHDICVKCYNLLDNKICPICRKKDILILGNNQIIVQEFSNGLLRWKPISYSIKRYIKTKLFKATISFVQQYKTDNKYVNIYHGFNRNIVVETIYNSLITSKLKKMFMLYDDIVSFEIFEDYYCANAHDYLYYNHAFNDPTDKRSQFFILNFKHHKDQIKEHILERYGYNTFSSIVI